MLAMKFTCYLYIIFTICCLSACVREDTGVPLAQPEKHLTEVVEQNPTIKATVAQIDLSENGDWKREDRLKLLRQKTQPIKIDLTWSQVDNDLLKQLHGLKTLQELSLFSTNVSDKTLQDLGELPNLESIDLGGCNVTIEGILYLRSSQKLKRLGLGDIRPPLDDNAIERVVTAWPDLESISLDASQITDTGLSHLGNLHNLQYLNISRTKITDEGLESLVGLTQLKRLHADNTKILDPGMVHLNSIKSLEKLNLNFTLITDQGLREIQDLTNLKRIYFVGTKVTDQGLQYLKPLKTIEYVGPSEHISPEALKELKDSLPLFKNNKNG